MQLTVIGSGDAFSAGGRLQTSFLIRAGERTILLDCGATILTGLAREEINPNEIDTIVISHLHGDHFAGLVWIFLSARHVFKREGPLTIIGPPGLLERLKAATDALYPGSADKELRFQVTHIELNLDNPVISDGLSVEAYEASHPSGGLSTALRLTLDGRVISFSGDTEWVEDLVACAAEADLFICECYAREPGVRYHLDWVTLMDQLPRLTAKRVLLTHLSRPMLDAVASGDVVPDDPRVGFGEDGMRVEIA